ncbi:MAG: 1-acyl-sn-glycerol-3-phosphate acyltransferase [Chloroflexi bacterium]|nr:1-acyl-sn-glycerol-3-phosphate acyltransferase [Chloroflexota bacterium]
MMKMAMMICRLMLLARIEVIGRKNIPTSGPYIVVLNHNSTVDTPVLLLSFPLQKWRFFAVEKWKYHPIFGPLMAWLGAIYIARDEVDRNQLRQALAAIESGTVFGLAPEGTRSRTGQMMAAKDGAAYLASRTQVPILPVGLENTDVLFSRFKKLKITPVKVHIGQPFHLPDLGRRARAHDMPAFTHLIMAHIAQQLPSRYHGVYGGSAAVAALARDEDPWLKQENDHHHHNPC